MIQSAFVNSEKMSETPVYHKLSFLQQNRFNNSLVYHYYMSKQILAVYTYLSPYNHRYEIFNKGTAIQIITIDPVNRNDKK